MLGSKFKLIEKSIAEHKEVKSMLRGPHTGLFCVLFQAIPLIDLFHKSSQQFSCAKMLHLTVKNIKIKLVRKTGSNAVQSYI